MRKIRSIAVPAAAAVIAAVCVLGGCTKKDQTAESTTAAESTSAAESTDETSAAEETVNPDAAAIEALDPKRPSDMGKVELGDLSTLSITAPEAQIIKDSDVDEYINSYILAAESVEKDVIENGDTANIDYEGKIDGTAFEGGTAQGTDLTIGSGMFIDGFESGLIGAKKGDKVTLNLKFPDNYGKEDLAGKDVVFDVTVNSVTRPMTVEDLTDEKSDELSGGNYKTVAEYKKAVREALELSAGAIAKGELLSNAIEAASGISTSEVSEAAIEWEMDLFLQNYDKSLSNSYGFGLADMLSMYGQSYDEFRTGLRESAEITAKQSAVVHEIAAQEGIEYNEEGLKKYLEEYGYSEDLVRDGQSEAWLEETVIQYLVGKHITDKAEVTFMPYEEYMAAAEAAAAAEAEAAAAETEAGAETEAAAETEETTAAQK